jgi:hypothetical protein
METRKLSSRTHDNPLDFKQTLRYGVNKTTENPNSAEKNLSRKIQNLRAFYLFKAYIFSKRNKFNFITLLEKISMKVAATSSYY